MIIARWTSVGSVSLMCSLALACGGGAQDDYAALSEVAAVVATPAEATHLLAFYSRPATTLFITQPERLAELIEGEGWVTCPQGGCLAAIRRWMPGDSTAIMWLDDEELEVIARLADLDTIAIRIPQVGDLRFRDELGEEYPYPRHRGNCTVIDEPADVREPQGETHRDLINDWVSDGPVSARAMSARSGTRDHSRLLDGDETYAAESYQLVTQLHTYLPPDCSAGLIATHEGTKLWVTKWGLFPLP